MTQSVENSGRTYHQCGECKLFYGRKKLAEECEAWCREHKTCNTEIIKHAVTFTGSDPRSDTQEKKVVKREERFAERERAERRRKLFRFAKRAGIAAVSAGAIGLLGWYVATRPEVPEIPEEEILSRSGLHWHPELAMYLNGKKEDIPANIGIGITHNPIHTHDSSNTVHLEFSGLVRKDDLRLGQFFKVWGKTFNRDQILDHRSGPEGMVTMLVNGEPNDQFENYVMQDKDKIEIRYEK